MSRLLRVGNPRHSLFPCHPVTRRGFIRSQFRSYATKTPVFKLLVSNLPSSMTPAEVKDLFANVGIRALKVPESFDGKISGNAEVEMLSENDVEKAVQQLDQTIVRGNKITVKKYDALFGVLRQLQSVEKPPKQEQVEPRFQSLDPFSPLSGPGDAVENWNVDFDPSKPRPPKFFEDKKAGHPAFDDVTGEEIYPGAWDDLQETNDNMAREPKITKARFHRGHLKGWLANIKTKYGIDIFNQFYDDADREMMRMSGMEGDEAVKKELEAMRIQEQTDDDQPDVPYTGEQDSWEQFVHDTSCSNPSNQEVLPRLRTLASDHEKLLGREDLTLVSWQSLPHDQGVEFQVRTDIIPDNAYWIQYSYFLSIYLTRLLDISSHRLFVNATDTKQRSYVSYLDDTSVGNVTITIVVLDKSRGDRSMNNEYDSELGPLAGVSVESEDYEKVKSKWKKKKGNAVLKKVDGELHMDLTNVYANHFAVSPDNPGIRAIVENNELITKFSRKTERE